MSLKIWWRACNYWRQSGG